MAGLVVDLAVPSAPAQRATPRSNWLILTAVVVGVFFGALACAGGLAAGNAHGTAEPSVPPILVHPPAHAGHLGSTTRPESPHAPAGDHGDHPASTSMTGHPGMACVVSVDLDVPEASVATVCDSYEASAAPMWADWPADVDPPVPRFS